MPQPIRHYPKIALHWITICLCWLALGLADEPGKLAPQTQAQLDALVSQLSSDDWKSREKAQQELARFGADAAPRLEALLEGSKDPDLRARVEGILKQIEENDASGPTFVTLHLK